MPLVVHARLKKTRKPCLMCVFVFSFGLQKASKPNRGVRGPCRGHFKTEVEIRWLQHRAFALSES